MNRLIKSPLQYILFLAMYPIARYVFGIKNKIKVTGRENLPHTTRVLFLSNHQTLIDSFLVGVNVISAKEIFFRQKLIPYNAPDRKNFLDHGFSKFFFGLLKNIPTDRNPKTLEKIQEQINSWCNILEENNLLLFFEGTRSRDGSIGKCKKGIAKTILQAQPDFIIPITLIGVSPIMPVDVGFNYRKISFGHRGQMIIGQPLDFSEIISSKLFSEESKISLICEKIEKTIKETKGEI